MEAGTARREAILEEAWVPRGSEQRILAWPENSVTSHDTETPRAESCLRKPGLLREARDWATVALSLFNLGAVALRIDGTATPSGVFAKAHPVPSVATKRIFVVPGGFAAAAVGRWRTRRGGDHMAQPNVLGDIGNPKHRAAAHEER